MNINKKSCFGILQVQNNWKFVEINWKPTSGNFNLVPADDLNRFLTLRIYKFELSISWIIPYLKHLSYLQILWSHLNIRNEEISLKISSTHIFWKFNFFFNYFYCGNKETYLANYQEIFLWYSKTIANINLTNIKYLDIVLKKCFW